MKRISNIRSRYMSKYSLKTFDFHFRMKVLQYVLFVILMVLAIFGSAVHAGNKQKGERCTSPDDCADGLTCRHIGARGFGNLGECRP